jgi:hypothetical protein
MDICMEFHHVWLGRNIKLQQTSCVSIAMPQKFSTDPDLLGYLTTPNQTKSSSK